VLGTAAIDEGDIEIIVICRGPLSASGILQGSLMFTHNLASTGHLVIPAAAIKSTSSTFNVTTAGLIAGLSVTSGSSVAYTFTQVIAEAINL